MVYVRVIKESILNGRRMPAVNVFLQVYVYPIHRHDRCKGLTEFAHVEEITIQVRPAEVYYNQRFATRDNPITSSTNPRLSRIESCKFAQGRLPLPSCEE